MVQFLNKWLRRIHRWLAVPLVMAVVLSLGYAVLNGPQATVPAWIGAVGIISILALLITGLYMFGQHYWAKWKRQS